MMAFFNSFKAFFKIEKPSEAWSSFVDNLQKGWQFVKGQVVDRFLASWTLLAGNFEKGVLKMRIAWNEFTGDSEEAEELKGQLKEVNKELKDAVQTLIDRNNEIKDGFNSAVDSVKNFAKQAKASYDKASEASEKLANAERRLVKNRIAMEKQQLESLRLAEDQRQIRDDISLSIEERIEANNRLGKILDEQSQKELALAQQQLNIALLQKQASGDTIENIEAVGDAELKILEIRERINGQRSEQLVNEQALLKEKQDKIDEDNKIEEEKELSKLEAIKKIRDDFKRAQEDEEAVTEVQKLELQRERQLASLTLLQEGLDAESEAYRLAEEQKALTKQAFDEKIREAEEQKLLEEEERKKRSSDMQKRFLMGNLSAIQNAAGEETKIGKALFLAKQAMLIKEQIIEAKATLQRIALRASEATVDTSKGAAATAKVGFPQNIPLLIAFAAQAAGIISSVKSAVKATKKVAGSAGGGVSVPSAGGGSIATASAPPQQANFNIVGGTPINQLAQSIGEQTNQPQQAYVVSGEVTTAQDLENNIIDSASIGG